MSTYIIDIETKPQKSLVKIKEKLIKPKSSLVDPKKIKADIESKKAGLRKSMSVDPDYAQIVCIGIKEVGVDGSEKLYSPRGMVKWFQDNMVSKGKAGHQDFKTCTLITFNGKDFDLPLLLKAGLKQNLDYPYRIINSYCIKRNSNYFSAGDYDNDASRVKHIDIKHLIAGSTQVKDAKSLDEYMQIYLRREKETKGEEFFANATDKDLKEHCLADLKDTEEMYLLFKKLI